MSNLMGKMTKLDLQLIEWVRRVTRRGRHSARRGASTMRIVDSMRKPCLGTLG